MKGVHFTVKVFVVYGSRKHLHRLMSVCIALETCFHYSGEYVYFSFDPTNFLNEHCPELGLKVDVERWSTNYFNFKVIGDNGFESH